MPAPITWLQYTFFILLGILLILYIVIQARLAKRTTLGIFTSVIGFALAMAFLSFLYAVAVSGGMKEQWKHLVSPQESDPAVEVVEIGYIRTRSGNLYFDNDLGWSTGDWVRVDAVTENEDLRRLPGAGDCGTLPFLPLHRRGFIDMKETCIGWGPGYAKVAYAIDAEGGIYAWRHNVGELGGFEKIIYPLFGLFLSLIPGVLIPWVISFFNFHRKKRKKATLEHPV